MAENKDKERSSLLIVMKQGTALLDNAHAQAH
jgi:hypothetical protein